MEWRYYGQSDGIWHQNIKIQVIHDVVFYEDVFSVRMIMWLYSRNGIIWNEIYIWNVMYYDVYDERWYEIYMECDGIYGM